MEAGEKKAVSDFEAREIMFGF